MKVCEVCGQEEEIEQHSNWNGQRILHICDNCLIDRRHDWNNVDV